MTELHYLRAEGDKIKEQLRSLSADIISACEDFRRNHGALTVSMAKARLASNRKTVQEREDEAIVACQELISLEAQSEGIAEGMKIQAKLLDKLSSVFCSQISSSTKEMEFTK